MSKITKPPTPVLALTIEEAANALSVSQDFWKEHIAAEVKMVRIGSRKMVPVSALQEWLDEHAERVA
jgi:excisionase family DNA binding protein